MPKGPPRFTSLLEQLNAGDRSVETELLTIVYGELHGLAAALFLAVVRRVLLAAGSPDDRSTALAALGGALLAAAISCCCCNCNSAR